MKKPVLIIDNSIDITGALKAILEFSTYAYSQFNFIYVLPTGSRAIEKVKEKGFDVVELPFVEISKNLKSLLFYIPFLFYNAYRIKRIVKHKDIKLVHVNDFYNLAGILAKVLGGRFSLITHVRFMPDRFPSLLVKLWIKLNIVYADAIICVSQAVHHCLPHHAKIRVIYDRLSDIPVSNRKIKEEASYINLLYLAHYIPGKGQNYALEAFYKALRETGNLRLKFVGGDMGLEKNKAFKDKLMARARDLNLDHVVEFAGPSAKTTHEIQTADIVLNFSESESFSMTCLEALTYGTPLIATNCGGPAELFVHGESGWLVPNQDINAMAEAITKLAYSAGLRESFSISSMDFVREKFSETNTYVKLVHIYLLCLLE